MPRKAGLFEASNGSIVEAYFLIRKGGINITPAWIERATKSRKKRQKELRKALKSNSLDALVLLKDWEVFYKKERFYNGLRVLLELERHGKTKYWSTLQEPIKRHNARCSNSLATSFLL